MSSPRFPCACSPSTTRAHSFIPLSVIRGLRRFNREARLGRVHAAPCACGASSSVPLSTRAHSPIPLSVISRSSRYGPEEEWAYCILPGRCSGVPSNSPNYLAPASSCRVRRSYLGRPVNVSEGMCVFLRVHTQAKKIVKALALGEDLFHVYAFGQLSAAIFTSRIQVTVDDNFIVQIVQSCEHFRRNPATLSNLRP